MSRTLGETSATRRQRDRKPIGFQLRLLWDEHALADPDTYEIVDPVRARLFAAARAAFLRHGYAEANLGRIAADAGISKKTIYKHVASKEALLFAIMQDSLLGPLAELGAPNVEQGPRERLTSFLTSFATLAFSPDGVVSYRLVLTEGARFPELARAYMTSLNDYAVSPLAREIAAYQSAGQLHPIDPGLAASMLFAMVIAEPMRDAALDLEAAPDAERTGRLIQVAVSIFMNGLARDGLTRP